MPQSPMEQSPLHRALVLSDQLQQLPPSVLILSFAINSLIAGVVWLNGGQALVSGLIVFSASILNWALLRRLPLAGRSFGPDKPAALALSAVITLALAALGLIGAPLVLGGLVVGLITALAYYAIWIEPFRLTLTRERLTTEAWGASLRLLHVSDLHVERISPREQELNSRIEHLKPDLIVFSGDFVNLSYADDAQARQDIRAIIGAWRAPLGVYCVPGTPVVEPLARVLTFVEGLANLDLLTNRWVSLETPGGMLHILGLITTHDLPTDRAALAQMMQKAPEGGLKLLLAHSPDIAPEAAAVGFDLYLCGHTHGGQIRLPLIGALLSSSQLGKRFVMGRYQIQGMTLYTSRGVGMEGLGAPRARLLCPPEITLWEISGQAPP